jgi:hypothetical protein
MAVAMVDLLKIIFMIRPLRCRSRDGLSQRHNVPKQLRSLSTIRTAFVRNASAYRTADARVILGLSPKIFLDAYAQYFRLEFGGSILDYRMAIIWLPWPSFGLGLDFNEFSTRLDVDGSEFNGRLEWNYRAPQVFLVASF